MHFPDKLSPSGQLEQFDTTGTTERFVLISESLEEFNAIRASLANVALQSLQSEIALDSEDAKILIDFMRTDSFQQGRLAVFPHQAERLARLIRQGGLSVLPENLNNQFDTRDSEPMDDERVTALALQASESMTIEVQARTFRAEINASLADDTYFK
jgi:hypothetical protein